MPERQHTDLPHISKAVMRLFAAYSLHYVRRSFHAMRILRSHLPPRDCARPLVVYLNHASWWDPLVCLLLSREFFANRSSFAPIDAEMLKRYGFFKRLGFFPVETHTTRGARTFLRTTQAILASCHHTLWLTPQGRFVDVRERLVRLQEGIGALAVRQPDAVFLPLAIEYAFWTEPRPEILVAFGEPIVPRGGTTPTSKEWTEIFGQALETAQHSLAGSSCRRVVSDWLTVDRGKSGVSAFYDAWGRLRAHLRGDEFVPDHLPDMRR